MGRAKITKKFVEDAKFSQKQKLIWDSEIPGFGVCIGSKSKSYFVQRTVKGRQTRVTIGRHGIFDTETARKRAAALLVKMTDGINPNEEKAKARLKAVRLQELYEHYKAISELRLSNNTLVNYQDFMDNQFQDWKNKPIAEISKEMVIEKHKVITLRSGPYAANASLQFLRALYNFAAIDDEELKNPVTILSKKKLWNPVKRRQSVIKDHQIAAWYKGVMNLQNETMRDALRVLLFTGMRKMEVFTLTWDNVDLENRSLFVPRTKNGSPLELPLSEELRKILQHRKDNAGDSKWVFPGSGRYGHITEPKKVMTQVTNESGVKFMIHDLRRTFITIAERIGTPVYTLKHLVNHLTNNDVTAGYIVNDIQRLREPVQKISDEILDLVRRG